MKTWAQLEELFNKIDTDKVGYIDFKQFSDHLMDLVRIGAYKHRPRIDKKLISPTNPQSNESDIDSGNDSGNSIEKV